MDKDNNKFLVWGILPMAFILISLNIPHVSHESDTWCWINWIKELQAHGMSKAYSVIGLNYPPVFLYILDFFGWIQGSKEEVIRNINYLKIIVLLFDFIGIYICIFYLRAKKLNTLHALLILLNAAYLYNTIVWGQVDSIHTALSLGAILLALQNFPILGLIVFVIALNMKLQSIIFFPLLALCLWYQLLNKKIIWAFIACAITQAIILFPFLLSGETNSFWKMVTASVGYYPFVSLNAYNFWNLSLWSTNLMQESNTIEFAGLTYKLWGTLLFLTASSIVLFPILGISILNYFSKETKNSLEYEKSFILAGGLITLIFFYFNTEMHERYSHPAILFIGLYAIVSRDYWIYIMLSIAYFLNMEGVLKSMELKNYSTLTFDPRFASALFLICIVGGTYKLYHINKSLLKELSVIIKIKFTRKTFRSISEAI